MKPSSPIAQIGASTLSVGFKSPGASSGQSSVESGVTLLSGTGTENLFPDVRLTENSRNFALYKSSAWLLGSTTVPISGNLEAVTKKIYQDMLEATRGWALCRVWNYVPQINAVTGNLENYRAFCRARAEAFEEEFGADHFNRLSAASAVGTDSDHLSVIFAATRTEPRHFENPNQLPAYKYPPEHGPRAPRFARATIAQDGSIFVSGTAAIKGHASICSGDLSAELACTVENLRQVSLVLGLGDQFATHPDMIRHFKIYLRNSADLALAKQFLESELLRFDDRVTWLRSDICRSELNIEIEASFVKTFRDERE